MWIYILQIKNPANCVLNLFSNLKLSCIQCCARMSELAKSGNKLYILDLIFSTAAWRFNTFLSKLFVSHILLKNLVAHRCFSRHVAKCIRTNFSLWDRLQPAVTNRKSPWPCYNSVSLGVGAGEQRRLAATCPKVAAIIQLGSRSDSIQFALLAGGCWISCAASRAARGT